MTMNDQTACTADSAEPPPSTERTVRRPRAIRVGDIVHDVESGQRALVVEGTSKKPLSKNDPKVRVEPVGDGPLDHKRWHRQSRFVWEKSLAVFL